MKSHSECDHHTCANDMDSRKIMRILIIITIFMLIELWGHWKTRSLSLLADSLHLLVDISGFIISILSLKISKRSKSSTMTFGYQRYEIIGAMLSVIFIWIAVGYLLIESVHKYIHPEEIDAGTFLGIAIIGLVVNIACVFVLHGNHYHKEMKNQNLNLRATYVHIIGDIIQSIGVILASTIIYFKPEFVIADVFCTLFFAFLVFLTTVNVIRDGIRILAEGAPKDIDQEKIKNFIIFDNKVIKILDFKAWALSANQNAICIRLLVDHILIKEYESLLNKIRTFLEDEMDIKFVNIQIETPNTLVNEGELKIGETVFSSLTPSENCCK